MTISESDWRKFKVLRELALDRFCQGVLNDAMTISQHTALSTYARYEMLYGLIRDRRKDLIQAFEYYSRSSAPWVLAVLVMHDLLTEAELSVLSEEMQQDLKKLDRRPYKLELGEALKR